MDTTINETIIKTKQNLGEFYWTYCSYQNADKYIQHVMICSHLAFESSATSIFEIYPFLFRKL